jgi:Phosphotransferase enzyme family
MAASDSLPLPPPDAELAVAATLLDAGAMTDHLGELFGSRVERVRVRYLDYAPGVSLTVQYDGRLADEGARLVEASATTEGSSWRLHAAPHDPALPLLGVDAGELTSALGLDRCDAPVARLAWVPNRRAVLRCGPYVVKLYADAAELVQAERALGLVADVLPTARLVASRPGCGAVVQEALNGRPFGRGEALRGAPAATEILHRLHDATIGGLDAAQPANLLDATRRPAALAAFAVPALKVRIEALIGALTERAPEPTRLVPVHGDFNVGQLLVDDERTWVVDVDTLAEGSPSVDLAAYVANLHNGRPGDDDIVAITRNALVQAYGTSPPDLTWHLAVTMLRRVDRPVRRLKKRWPDRTTAIVEAIERILQ